MWKKKIFKKIILIILLILIVSIYLNNFRKEDSTTSSKNSPEILQIEKEDSLFNLNNSNIFSDVEYFSQDLKGNKFIIRAKKGEINNEATNIVFLTDVNARIELINSNNIYIKSDYAKYKIDDYDTIFSNNVTVNYLDNMIKSEHIDFSIQKNIMNINDNVIYSNSDIKMYGDAIKINILTKDINIFMYEKNNKVKIKSNNWKMVIIKKFRIKSYKQSQPIIEFENISIAYGNRLILDNISFKINSGQIFGMLGPNGVGKSTIFNIITGLIKPQNGKIKISGIDVTDYPVYLRTRKFNVGYVPQYGGFFSDLTLHDNMKAIGEIVIDDKNLIKDKINYLLNKFELENIKSIKAKFLSGGQKKKACNCTFFIKWS